MKIAKIVFWIAGIWGVLVITPLFFLIDTVGRMSPPLVTHPEFYYGFVSVAFSWQIAFIVIALDPARYRALMIPAMLEKFGFWAIMLALYAQGRVASSQIPLATVDLLLGLMFVVAFFSVRNVHEFGGRHRA